jgi:hypothetical protein
MPALLHDLLCIIMVARISGAGWWPQFEKWCSPTLPHGERLVHLSLPATYGTKFFRDSEVWTRLIQTIRRLLKSEKIVSSLKNALGVADFEVGEVVEDGVKP